MLRTLSRRAVFLIPVFILTWLAPDGRDPAAAELPRVRLIATGGTIASRPGGSLTAQDLAAAAIGAEKHARLETEQFSSLGSSQLTLDHWLRLARRITELFRADADLSGVVVTSGTDTLEEIAYFLHLTVRDPRPVVVVGAMRTSGTLGYEGAANLLDGVRVAADRASRGKGVLVVLNGEINSAREVTKTDALRLHTFQSRGYGILGVADADRVVYYRETLRRHTAESEFDPREIEKLPRVDILMVYQEAPGDLIKAAVENGARGLVIASAGAGALSGTQREALAQAARQGVWVVTSTRTGSGRVGAPTEAQAARARERAGADSEALQRFIAAEDLAPLKARILLMLALSRTADPAEIKRMFLEY